MLLAGLQLGCAHGSPITPKVSEDMAPLADVVRVIGRFGAAHACPVIASDGQRYLLTAAHVLDERPFDRGIPLYPSRWSDGAGNEGRAEPLIVDVAADLGWYVAPERLGGWYRLASAAPVAGDVLQILGYRWDKATEVLADKPVKAKVTRVVAGHIALDEDARRGASGGCVLNSAREVVGILVWAVAADFGSPAGVAVGVWGEWGIPPKAPEVAQ